MIDKLCNILHCNVEDIMEHIEDDNLFWNQRQKTTRAAGKFPAVFSFPNPFVSAAAGFSHGGVFSLFPMRKNVMLWRKTWYKRDRNMIETWYWGCNIFTGKGTRLFSDATKKETLSLTRAYPDLHPTDKEKQPGFFMPCRKVFLTFFEKCCLFWLFQRSKE